MISVFNDVTVLLDPDLLSVLFLWIVQYSNNKAICFSLGLNHLFWDNAQSKCTVVKSSFSKTYKNILKMNKLTPVWLRLPGVHTGKTWFGIRNAFVHFKNGFCLLLQIYSSNSNPAALRLYLLKRKKRNLKLKSGGTFAAEMYDRFFPYLLQKPIEKLANKYLALLDFSVWKSKCAVKWFTSSVLALFWMDFIGIVSQDRCSPTSHDRGISVSQGQYKGSLQTQWKVWLCVFSLIFLYSKSSIWTM